MEFVMHKKLNILQWDAIINYYVKYMFWENYNTYILIFHLFRKKRRGRKTLWLTYNTTHTFRGSQTKVTGSSIFAKLLMAARDV